MVILLAFQDNNAKIKAGAIFFSPEEEEYEFCEVGNETIESCREIFEYLTYESKKCVQRCDRFDRCDAGNAINIAGDQCTLFCNDESEFMADVPGIGKHCACATGFMMNINRDGCVRQCTDTGPGAIPEDSEIPLKCVCDEANGFENITDGNNVTHCACKSQTPYMTYDRLRCVSSCVHDGH